jgi:Tannase-like family of unknown function (DUF6351)
MIGKRRFAFGRPGVVGAVVLVAALWFAVPAWSWPRHGSDRGGLTIVAVSNPHPDLVSGGEVLLRVSPGWGVAARRLRITLNGADVSPAFAAQPDGSLLGLLTGLRDGPNIVRAQASGRFRGGHQARLVVVNHPITGPVFSGPQQLPFYCQTTAFAGLASATQPECSATRVVSYEYMSTSGAYKPWPTAGSAPAPPYPSDLATTTVDGRSVPYIVRLEQGTIDRGVYQIAALYDGHKPTPYSPDRSWNGRLVYTFGGGCNSGYHQGTSTGGVIGAAAGPGGEDLFLSQGYAVASNSLNVLDNNCSIPISAEAAMMTKEHFIDEYGPVAHTIGWGGSGGAIQQYGIADAYPGILNGIIPSVSFPDPVGATLSVVTDCRLLDDYFAAHSGYSVARETAISGFGFYSSCPSWDATFANRIQATASCNPAIPSTVAGDPNTVWNATTNPDGVKCDARQQLVNQLGVDPATGFAPSPLDNVGVQYGLAALDSGAITPAEFADLNANIGGFDYLGNPTAERSQASPVALHAVYADDLDNSGAQGLEVTPIIDQRDDLDAISAGDLNIHTSEWSFVMRARLQKAGDAANQVIIENAFDPTEVANVNAYELSAMNEWLDNIAADGSRRPPTAKIARDKPAGLADGCFLSPSQTSPTLQPGGLTAAGTSAPCETVYPIHADTRIAAGQPEDLYTLKCALVPIDWSAYPVTFTPAEQAELETAFPNGVCDYNRRGPQERPPTGTWLNYSRGTTPFPDAR